jgi:hypothetical protein
MMIVKEWNPHKNLDFQILALMTGIFIFIVGNNFFQLTQSKNPKGRA